MSFEVAVVFVLFAIPMALSPGAGNITLMGISNRYGFNASLPFIAGTACGVAFVFAGASAGLVNMLQGYPGLFEVMKYSGAAYLLYLAWGIAAGTSVDCQDEQRSPGFGAGIFVQVMNPKAWIAAMMAFSQFADLSQEYLPQAVMIISLFAGVVIISNLSWAYFGAIIKKLLRSPRQLLLINRCLGGTLAITVVVMLSGPLQVG
ncbi:MAG: LysE family translocator [Pontibacterium sp.]